MSQRKRKSGSTVPSIEARVEALEQSVRALQAADPIDKSRSWIKLVAGSFEKDEDNIEAARLGAKYRQRQPKC